MLISVSTFVPNNVGLNFKDKRLKWILYKVQWPKMRFGNKNELLLWNFYGGSHFICGCQRIYKMLNDKWRDSNKLITSKNSLNFKVK